MKMSEAILRGMERFPVQAFGAYWKGDDAACAIGCGNWAMTGFTAPLDNIWEEMLSDKFLIEYGIGPYELNDMYEFPRDVIAGMFAAIGE